MSSATNQSYSGWSNRETWLANLWLCNDERSYSELMYFCAIDAKPHKQADLLREHMNRRRVLVYTEACLEADLYSAAFSKISWIEIIQAQAE